MNVKLALAGVVLAMSTLCHAQNFPTLSPEALVAKYGKPDAVKSSEYENPRPPIVTRMIEYRKERVRFVLFPDAPVGSPPPYKRWKLLGMQDSRDNSVLTASEVERRMQGRVKK